MLHVRVVKAVDIPAMDRSGKTDAYCVLALTGCSKTLQTSVQKNSMEPEWNEEFHIPCATTRGVFSVYMKDLDKHSVDDPISILHIPLSKLPIGKVVEDTYSMEPVEGVEKGGNITLVLHLANSNDAIFQDAV